MTHREAFANRAPHLPPSDCDGELVPRRLRGPRGYDPCLKCRACATTVRVIDGRAVWASYNGAPISLREAPTGGGGAGAEPIANDVRRE